MMQKWFSFYKEKKENNINMFCFHHAGGSAAMYKEWVNHAENINVFSIELPGKGMRRMETPIDNMNQLAQEIANAVKKVSSGKRIILYGHSMGAAIAFSVAKSLYKDFATLADLLIVASRQAPHLPNKDKYHSSMGDECLIAELKRMGGTPEEILNNDVILSLILPSIKSDYVLHESFIYGGEKLNIPIIAHYSEGDVDVNEGDIVEWQEVTTKSCSVEKFKGDHFFLAELGVRYFQELEQTILRNLERERC